MDDILSLLQDFDVANFLPPPERFMQDLEWWVRLLVLIGPLVVLGLGIWYYFLPPKEANHSVGFRTYWGMGSVEAWAFSQKLAGLGYMVTGGVLTLVMFIISLTFQGENGFTMIIIAAVCIVIELLLVVALWVGLNVLIYRAYDKDGNRRLNTK